MLKELRNQHRTIIQMAFSGFKNKEIAERLSMTESTISGILRSPLGQAYMGGLHDKSKENTLDVRKQLISMNSAALASFERILSPSGKAPYAVQFNTAKDILDRNGFKPTDKINIDLTLKAKSDQEIDAEINALTNSIARAKASVAEATELNPATELNDEEESSENLPPHTAHAPISPMDADTDDLLQTSEDSSSPLNLLESELTKTSVDVFPPK